MTDLAPPPRQQRCSICGKPTEPAFKPFCSGRCADVDLSRWLNGAYAIPGGTADTDEDGDQSTLPIAPPSDEDDA
jgi:uncharacterized protein